MKRKFRIQNINPRNRDTCYLVIIIINGLECKQGKSIQLSSSLESKPNQIDYLKRISDYTIIQTKTHFIWIQQSIDYLTQSSILRMKFLIKKSEIGIEGKRIKLEFRVNNRIQTKHAWPLEPWTDWNLLFHGDLHWSCRRKNSEKWEEKEEERENSKMQKRGKTFYCKNKV